MKRFLFAFSPFAGHVNHVLAVAEELAARGHHVAWLAEGREIAPLVPDGTRLVEISADPPRGTPLGLRALSATEAAMEEFRPDAVLVDRLRLVADLLTLAATFAARRLGTPWATAMTGVVAALPEYAKGLRESRAQYDGRLRALQHEAGLEAAEWPLLSPHLVLVFSTPALLGQASSFPSHYRLVGPALGPRLERASFPWHELRDGPRVLVSLGTISGARGGRFFAAVVEALGATDVQVVLVAPPELVPAAPDNVIVAPEVPQLGLLPHVNAVVSHGGHNTISEALAEGLPLVLAPIHDDQPILARQVATAGAGIRLRFDRATPREIRAAVEKVLREPAYREAAVRIRASFEEAGGARAAAEALEALAA